MDYSALPSEYLKNLSDVATGKAELTEEDKRIVKMLVEMGVDLTPIVGDIKALFYDTPKGLMSGNYGDAALAAASAVPFFGAPADVARAAKTATKESRYLENVAAKTTQRANTTGTAIKASNYLDEIGAKGKSLDYGAGLGENAKAIKADDTFEPFPTESFTPTFSKPSEVPANTYGKVISTNVLNVLPPDIRSEAVLNIGKSLKKGGKALIQTWDVNAAKAGMKSKKATPVRTEENAFTTSTGSYQKGFSKPELKSYVESVLGDLYTVEIVPNKAGISGTAVVITKN